MEEVRTLLEDGVLEITFNRPQRRNAMTAIMYAAAADALARAQTDEAVRAVVFTGEGKDFCAGNDLTDFLQDYDLQDGTPWRRFLEALPAATKPLLAAVQGNAVGIGLTMLLHLDLVYLEPCARLAAPFARLGVVPEAGSSGLLPERIGRIRANGLFLLGQSITADEAVRLGLANEVLSEGGARAAALASARAIAALPQGAASAAKRLMATPYASTAQRLDAECTVFMERIRHPETRAVLQALGAPRQVPTGA